MHHPNCPNHDNDGKVTPAQLAAADRRHRVRPCDMLGLAVHRILTADGVVAPRG